MTHMKWGEPDPFWEYRKDGLFDTRTTRRTSTGPSTMTDYQIGEPMDDRERASFVEVYGKIAELRSQLVVIHIMISTLTLLILVAFIFIFVMSRI